MIVLIHYSNIDCVNVNIFTQTAVGYVRPHDEEVKPLSKQKYLIRKKDKANILKQNVPRPFLYKVMSVVFSLLLRE